MSGTASWFRSHRLDVLWAIFVLANVVAMGLLAGRDGGTIPFHFIWVSLTIVYGFTVWRLGPTVAILGIVMILTSMMILLEVIIGPTRPDEFAEVPLMAAMFLAMVWHARRRAAAERDAVAARERERDFIRDASHTLKTPLALARGYSELLLRDARDGEQFEDAEKVVGELNRLTRIVDNLLLLTTSGQDAAMHLDHVDLSGLVLDTTERWRVRAERRFLVYADDPAYILGDRERLEYALDALIENAVDATEAEDRIWIAVSSRRDGRICLQVADEGHGLSSEAAIHLFERFWSEPGHRGRRGTGLGLAIVKAVVDAHGGSIDVAADGQATIFTVTLANATARDSNVGSSPPSEHTDLVPALT